MDKLPSSTSSQRLPSSSHRLPTISASQAFQSLQAKGPRVMSTGLGQLDRLLASTDKQNDTSVLENRGGLERGKLMEVWGPPGAGKTSLAMKIAAEARSAGNSVVWVDTASPLVKPRFQDILQSSTTARLDDEYGSNDFNSYYTPTVAHLIALIMHAPSSFPPPNTSLMIIDGIHSVFDVAYPRHSVNNYSNKNDAAKWASGRRYSVLNSLMAALKKLAALNDMAILVTTGCATRVRNGSGFGAHLVPGVGGMEWESGISNRLVIFRDFASPNERLVKRQSGGDATSARFIGLQKLNGTAFGDEGDMGYLIPFMIEKSGIREIEETPVATDTTAPITLAVSSPIKNRKRRHTEIVDSDEEDAGSEYGWLDEDAEGLIDAAALNEDGPDSVQVVPADD